MIRLVDNYSTGHLVEGLVKQLTRGIPSLVPVPMNITCDWSTGNSTSPIPLEETATQIKLK